MAKRYVAVITKNDFTSAREMGDWACFCADTKDEAIQRAVRARERWEANGRLGPYEIFVGQLTERVNEPAFAYSLSRLR